MTEMDLLIRIDQKLDTLVQKVDRLEARMDSLEARMDSLEARMDSLEARMDSLETRMDSLELKVDSLEQRIYSLETRVNELEEDVRSVKICIEEDVRFGIRVVAENHLNLDRKLNEVIEMKTERDKTNLRIVSLEIDVKALKEKVNRVVIA